MATIYDVARLSGVSTATVSHVCNDSQYVSDGLRKKVLDAMEVLHYRPSAIARGLKGVSLRSVGLIVPDCTNSFFAEMARAVDRLCFSRGYNIILCNTDNNVQQQSFYTDMLISKHVDGIMFISTDGTDTEVQKCRDFSIPVVIVDREVPYDSVDNIVVDNEQGGKAAALYLIGLGFARIACITGPEHISSSEQRLRGFRETLTASGIELPDEYVCTGNFHYSGGMDAFTRLFSLVHPPEAVFACNDMMAVGFIHKAIVSGVRVPEDISVIGFDNTELSSMMLPRLTTVAQPIEELAESTVQRLLLRIDKPETDVEHIRLSPRLIPRDTCLRRK